MCIRDRPSVSVAMKKLRENNLITVDGDGYIHLTEDGLAIANRMYERHKSVSYTHLDVYKRQIEDRKEDKKMTCGKCKYCRPNDICNGDHECTAKNLSLIHICSEPARIFHTPAENLPKLDICKLHQRRNVEEVQRTWK